MAELMQLESVAEFAEAIGLDIAIVTQKLAVDLHTAIVKRTPVDTGRARANWQMGIGSMPTGTLASADKQDFGSEPTGGAPEAKSIDGTESVFIVNNLPYIAALEDGSSKQAPQGMVAVSVAQIQGEIDAFLS